MTLETVATLTYILYTLSYNRQHTENRWQEQFMIGEVLLALFSEDKGSSEHIHVCQKMFSGQSKYLKHFFLQVVKISKCYME